MFKPVKIFIQLILQTDQKVICVFPSHTGSDNRIRHLIDFVPLSPGGKIVFSFIKIEFFSHQGTKTPGFAKNVYFLVSLTERGL